MSTADDAELARRARADEAAFAELVARYRDRVFRVCAGVLGDRERAEDAAQDTFLKVYRRLDSYDPAHAFSSWLFTAAARTAIDMARARKREREVIATHADAVRRARAAAGEDPRLGGLRGLLPRLPADWRAILTLRFAEGMSCADIAKVLGRTPNAVSVAIYKAKQQLLEWMEG